MKRGPGNMKFLSALCLCVVLANVELGQGASLAQGETNIDIYILYILSTLVVTVSGVAWGEWSAWMQATDGYRTRTRKVAGEDGGDLARSSLGEEFLEAEDGGIEEAVTTEAAVVEEAVTEAVIIADTVITDDGYIEQP